MPIAVCRPVITSNSEIPDRYGGPSGSPVRLISPDMACTMQVVAGQACAAAGAETADRAVDHARVPALTAS